ncbi:MAG: tetratricopeptide repeat protein [Deltaproteobacteria bacterium]|nr:tetratricopeptide repeat protein [Deltaproteobacteria bacterium]
MRMRSGSLITLRVLPLAATLLLLASPAHATQITTYDDSGAVQEMERAIATMSAEDLESAALNLLEAGRITAMQPFAEQWLRLDLRSRDAAALVALAYAASSRSAEARELLAEGGASGSRWAPYAESLLARRDGDLSRATALVRRGLNESGGHPYGWNLLGRIQFEAGETRDASTSFDKAVTLSPNFLPGYLNLGASAFVLQDYVGARKAFERAIELDPESAPAYYGLAVAMRDGGGSPAAALEALEIALALDPTLANALLERPRFQVRAGRSEDAVESARALVEGGEPLGPIMLAEALIRLGRSEEVLEALADLPGDQADVLYLRGLAQIIGGDPKAGAKTLVTALSADEQAFGPYSTLQALRAGGATRWSGGSRPWMTPPQVAILSFLAGCEAGAGSDWKAAYAAWSESRGLGAEFDLAGVTRSQIEASSKPAEFPLLALGALYHLADLHQAAGQELALAVKAAPRSVLSNYWLAQHELAMKQRERARKALETSLASAPGFVAVLHALADIGMATGDTEAALGYYERLRVAQPGAISEIKLGVALDYVGRLDDAITAYERAIAAEPHNYLAHSQLAWALARQGKDLERALEHAREADRLAPDNGSVLDTLAWIVYLKGNPEDALVLARRAVQVKPVTPTRFYHLAVIEHALGNNASAKVNLHRALDEPAQFGDAAKARELLESLE